MNHLDADKGSRVWVIEQIINRYVEGRSGIGLSIRELLRSRARGAIRASRDDHRRRMVDVR